MDEKVSGIIDGMNLTDRPVRDPARIKPILEYLENEWLKNPDLRLGQLFINLIRIKSDVDSIGDLFLIEDEELFPEILEKLKKNPPN